jgi:hypothetical protein
MSRVRSVHAREDDDRRRSEADRFADLSESLIVGDAEGPLAAQAAIPPSIAA